MGTSLFTEICNIVWFIGHEMCQPTPAYLPPAKRQVMVSWTPPPPNAFKINVDGSHNSTQGCTACGGLIRDSCGNFGKGFYCNLGLSNPLWAEMWALLLGTRLARTLSLREVVFEMDSLTIVQTVNKGYSNVPYLQPLLDEVLHLLRLLDWKASVTHSYREANRCADHLAALRHGSDFSWTMLDSAPSMLRVTS